ncbi:MAG: transposase, partial [Candidatus Cyclobacteriaceae bacterium M3_2C_046]
AYAVKINDFSSKEIRKLFDSHIDNRAKVNINKTRVYRTLKGDYNLQKKEAKQNHPLMNRFMHGLKSWITGIHHHVSDRFLQGYLNEYCYRFNRNRQKSMIFHIMVVRMLATPPAPYKILHNT